MEQEYGIKSKPDSSGNPQANTIIERIHKLLGNLIRYFNLHDKYVDDADPWMGILAAADFVVQATYHRIKQKCPGQLVFGRYMILSINHIANRRLTHQHKQAQTDKDVIRENSTRVNFDYRIGDWVIARKEMTLNMKHHLKFCKNYSNLEKWNR